MEEKNNPTIYDNAVETRELKMLKTMIPYFAGGMQRQLAFLVQYMEFKNTMDYFTSEDNELVACDIPEGTDRRIAMLGALKPYCTQREQETIDSLLNLFCILDNYDSFLH